MPADCFKCWYVYEQQSLNRGWYRNKSHFWMDCNVVSLLWWNYYHIIVVISVQCHIYAVNGVNHRKYPWYVNSVDTKESACQHFVFLADYIVNAKPTDCSDLVLSWQALPIIHSVLSSQLEVWHSDIYYWLPLTTKWLLYNNHFGDTFIMVLCNQSSSFSSKGSHINNG